MLTAKNFSSFAILSAFLSLTGFNALCQPKSITFNTTESVWAIIDCANDGLGELVEGDITIHWIQHFNAEGEITKVVAHPKGGILIGEITGIQYRATGASLFLMDNNPDKGAFTDTMINRFHIVGHGGTQFTAFFTIHLTVNVKGEVVTEFERVEFDCK